MTKTTEVQPEGTALVKQFHAALKGANSHMASPAKVKAFEEALSACVKADVLSECVLKTPLGAACDFALEAAKKQAGPAVPMIWEEQAREMREGFAYDYAPLLERMMIENVILCYFRLTVAELVYSSALGSGTIAQIEHHQKRANVAQKRFARAAESLARVRKLSCPSVQINVAAEGRRQVNVV